MDMFSRSQDEAWIHRKTSLDRTRYCRSQEGAEAAAQESFVTLPEANSKA